MFKNKQKQITLFMGIFLLSQFGFQVNASANLPSWAEMAEKDGREARAVSLVALVAIRPARPSQDSLSSNGGGSSSGDEHVAQKAVFDVNHLLFGKMLEKLAGLAKQVSLKENALRNVCFNPPAYLPFEMQVPVLVFCPDGSRAMIDENTQLRKDLGMGKYVFYFWGTPDWFKGSQSVC